MQKDFNFRHPTQNDLSKLASLGRQTFVETFGDLYESTDLDAFLEQVYSESAVSGELNDPRLTYRVIEHEDDLIGYIKIGPVHVPIENPAPDAMEVWQLFVRQSHIGSGLGTQLMQWADQQFADRRASEVYVSVFSDNQRAIRFYRQHGFEKVGEYGFRVGQQVDREWIMRRLPNQSLA